MVEQKTDAGVVQIISFMLPLVAAIVSLGGMIFGIGWIGKGFEQLTGDQLTLIIHIASNPYLGLLVGIISTALVQSSSTITSIIVGLVAGGLPVDVAIPMVMGANLGSTVTNTIVSLMYIGDRVEFRRAFAAATIHDMFNLLGVGIFLPLELLLHPLQNLATGTASWLQSIILPISFGLIMPTVPCVRGIYRMGVEFAHLVPDQWSSVALLAVGFLCIAVSIAVLSIVLKSFLLDRLTPIVRSTLGRNGFLSILFGAGITALVQSSSTTTSVMIPLAGVGLVELEQVYPFTLGANIGTCVTALLAALILPYGDTQAAVAIAVVHFLFNALSVLVIYSNPVLRPLPLQAAQFLANLASMKAYLALLYVLSLFFILPAMLLTLNYVI